MAANHSIAIDLLFHLIAVTDIDELSPWIAEILGTKGSRLQEAEFLSQISIKFRYRLNRSKDFSFLFGDI
ncbi:hypothetical protein QUA70_22020 [Microcoleus sp. LAD1_D5]|uniref:hypothetical protein n=1 Tax=unclassified Microcoleus TaxID=2642155 RepID=UPI002FCF26E3